jgi:glycosyltransferase involved in cell wall biosynthesis
LKKNLLIYRKPRSLGNFSMEGILVTLAPYLKNQVSFWQAPEESKGFWPRLISVCSLRSFLKQHPHEVVHVFGDVNFLLWGAPKVRRILTVHDIGFLYQTKGIKRMLLRYFWLSGPLKKAHAVVAVSEATKQEIQRWYPRQKISVIPTVIDPRFVRQDKPFNDSCPSILLLGTAPNKNLNRVLLALQHLPIKLTLVGKCTREQNDLLAKLDHSQKDRVSFEELLSLYFQADIVMLCSTHEGFGMPILEAQATGRVIITSNCSSMPEIAGEGACLVDPFSVESIRMGVQLVINDRSYRNSLIEKGFRNVQRFQAADVAKQYLDLYQSLLQ